ncbi:YybH family protein [Psychroserpens sp. S379A]|uniref:YybH family protein n=1 Tax=Psychroserpens sp. S379A TaxID=3415137 RepID=UPI003C7AA908
MKHLLLYFITTMLFYSCSNEPKIGYKTEGEELMQFSRDWSNLVKTGDMEKIMAGWTEESVMMAPGLPPLKGKKQIQNYLIEGSKIPGFAIRWEPLEVHISKSGDMAYMIERNEVKVNDSIGNPIFTYNKVVTIWEKQEDGSWKNVVDIWNDNPNGKY